MSADAVGNLEYLDAETFVRAQSEPNDNKKVSLQRVFMGRCYDTEVTRLKPTTFIDVAAMKEKVKQSLIRPTHNVTDYYKTSGWCQAFARSARFEGVTLAIIALNAIWIAIDTDNNEADILLEAHPLFVIVENLFCVFFSFEWFVRFMSFRWKRDVCKDAQFLFDTLLVSMMVMETWFFSILSPLAMQDPGGGDTSVLRVARVMRLSRMARIARLLRAMPELMILIKGISAAARSVFFTLCLLFLIMFVFAIAFVQLTVETPLGSEFFPTVPQSMFVLLLHGTLLDDVGRVARVLGTGPFYISILFFTFVLLASFTVMNMLIGVLCDVVSAVAATQKEEMLVTYVHQKMHKVIKMLDTDGGGTISKTEFLKILENATAVRCLQDVGVDVIGLVDFADFIFGDAGKSEDQCSDKEELDFERFMDVVLQLRGSNNATVKDIVDLRKFVQSQFELNRTKLVEDIKALNRGTCAGTGFRNNVDNYPLRSVKSDGDFIKARDNARASVVSELKQAAQEMSTRTPTSVKKSSVLSPANASPSKAQTMIHARDLAANMTEGSVSAETVAAARRKTEMLPFDIQSTAEFKESGLSAVVEEAYELVRSSKLLLDGPKLIPAQMLDQDPVESPPDMLPAAGLVISRGDVSADKTDRVAERDRLRPRMLGSDDGSHDSSLPDRGPTRSCLPDSAQRCHFVKEGSLVHDRSMSRAPSPAGSNTIQNHR